MIEFENNHEVKIEEVEIDYPLALLRFYTRINVELDKLSINISRIRIP